MYEYLCIHIYYFFLSEISALLTYYMGTPENHDMITEFREIY